MLTGELRSKIDGVWNAFWAGGIANPLEVIEQITYLLFMRGLDDAHTLEENKTNRLGKPMERRIFPPGKDKIGKNGGIAYEDMRWSRLKNRDPATMFEIVSEHVFPFLRSMAEEGTAHATHMKGARFTIPTPALLAKVVDLLAEIPMEDRDTKGDLYEYMLSKIATAGQNGQFRTPRHIIALMVGMMAPGPKDVIVDPACGTCGFLVATGEYLRENHPKLFHEKKSRDHFNEEMFHGFDFDGTMLRIGSMNMTLHGVEDPDIRYRDSLAQEHAGDADRYSLVLANPPFAGSLDYETTAKDLLAIVKTKKTELLFMALFLKLLKPGGRAAVIVPDGVLFGSTTAHKDIRRMLVEDHRIDGIVKLPSGVFRPYAGVSTAIVLFTKTNSGGTDNVWFYDCQADGFSLDDKRTSLLAGEKMGPSARLVNEEHAKNNLPDIATRWKERNGSEYKRPRAAQSLRAEGRDRSSRLRSLDQSLQEGRARSRRASPAKGDYRRVKRLGEGDYGRVGGIGGNAVNAHWPIRRLGDIFEIARGGSPRPIERFITDDPAGLNWIKIGDATGGGKFIETTKEKIKREGLSKTRFVNAGDFLLTNSMSFGRPYILATDGCIHDGWLVLKAHDRSLVDQDYFYHLLGSDAVYQKFASRASGSTVKNLNTEIVSSVEIKLPPFEEQQRIAAVLDKADALRRRRKYALDLLDDLGQSIFLQMFGDPESNPKRWKRGRIGDLLEETQYGTGDKAGEVGKIPILRMGNITYKGRTDFKGLKYIDLRDDDVEKFTVRRGDILFNRTNSADLVGKTAVFDRDEMFAFAGYLVRARVKSGVSPHYVSSYLNSRHGKATLRGMAKSIVGMANINAKEMQSIMILIPDAQTQREYSRALSSIEVTRAACHRHLRLLDSFFSSLQSRAFSGQL